MTDFLGWLGWLLIRCVMVVLTGGDFSLQWGTAGTQVQAPSEGNPRLPEILHVKPAVGQNIALVFLLLLEILPPSFFSFQSFHIIFSQSSSNIVTCCKRVLCLQRSVMVQLCIPSYWNCSYLREIIVIWLNFTTGGQPLFEWSKVFQAWWDYNHNQNLPWCVASCIFSTNVCPLYGCYTHFHHHVLYAFGTSMHI